MKNLLEILTSTEPSIRHKALEAVLEGAGAEELIQASQILDRFRRDTDNLYARVRALLFLACIHRYQLPQALALTPPALEDIVTGKGALPFKGCEQLLHRRFEEAIDTFLSTVEAQGYSDCLCSALANAYHRLAFQTLADQVRRSVRSVRGNQWMFRMGHPSDQPLRIHPELLRRSPEGAYPILREETPVRMDLTHSGWSDIFFLSMDFPEGAHVINASIDLGVHNRDAHPRPPVSAWLRVLDEPVLRLTSVDLGATADVTSLAEVFDFAKDHLGLLKAAVIASGVVPPGMEGSGQSLAALLASMLGPGRGLEIVSCVNDIPKGSRLAVSTNLLGSLIAVCMRATSQATSLTGTLQESERRLALARALLGEWLGGSGGGWQDSGGLWPGVKWIRGVTAKETDLEWTISRGRLMPEHHVFNREELPVEALRKLEQSLVLVHGGLAQNVGPILEMVTEKYLLRSRREWSARSDSLSLFETLKELLKQGEIRRLGAETTNNFRRCLCTIIPWATNAYTERLISDAEAEFGDDFWGFWMLGGMSGGGMGFLFAPHRKKEAQARMLQIMHAAKRDLQTGLPFAMEPVVYDFSINEQGTTATLLEGEAALMPPAYYSIMIPALLKKDRGSLSQARRAELDSFGEASRSDPNLRDVVPKLFDVLLPRHRAESQGSNSLHELLRINGFDPIQHEQIRQDLKEGRIGLSLNRLRHDAVIECPKTEDVTDVRHESKAGRSLLEKHRRTGETSLRNGEIGVVTLAAGAGSRWTQGAGVCKALHPFASLKGRHRTFLEVHIAKSRRTVSEFGRVPPHVITASYLTYDPIRTRTSAQRNFGYPEPVIVSQGCSVGLRLVPTERDLRFAWEEMAQQHLDEQQQKVRDSLRASLIRWAQTAGEASDYTDNTPMQCMHPIGHWYEVPNLLRNGLLAQLLARNPQLKHLMLHNLDTLGANLDPGIIGWHVASGRCLNFEVITRRLEDRGGGLARVNGQLRLVEGLALPREEDEFKLPHYNSMTTWICIDALLESFGLDRDSLQDRERVASAVRSMAARIPTYVTLKDVKKRWGSGQEDVFPVAQFEKLWSDLTMLPEIQCGYALVSRQRGQQLKDPAQLDGWVRDGSAAYIESLCEFEPSPGQT
ncbi:MAG: UTP--glucose-1-phosphate uridylyltransferase [Verrucomicrobia bacterium]|nr:UTP--glucose-1-phosphate uridylyltransferase [Verrucomicrobiota bacterium]